MKELRTAYNLSGHDFGDDFQVNRKPYRMASPTGNENPCRALPLSTYGGPSAGEEVLIWHSGKVPQA